MYMIAVCVCVRVCLHVAVVFGDNRNCLVSWDPDWFLSLVKDLELCSRDNGKAYILF